MRLDEAFPTVLVANRGEIALRIMRTLRRLGIRTAVVRHPLEGDALHAREADVVIDLKGEHPVRAYLDIEQMVAAALTCGAAAVHPGYGFLSENPAFPRALATAGVCWIGPHAEAIAAMGDKIASKDLARRAGVRIVPGGVQAAADVRQAVSLACEAGFPVMLKASAGGGGKGLRIARTLDEVAPSFEAASAEAVAAFGDGRIMVERYIDRARHIEVQVLGDRHGRVLSLGERECSVQRRNQKIIEEAPSAFLRPETRAAMSEQAVRLARQVGYDNAGTVEFIVGPDQSFFFIEMNTRLQVEHPVTELVTGLDLVELQLRSAAGEKLELGPESPPVSGAAIELRVYAEDPDEGFLPSTGAILRFDAPDPKLARLDCGVREGSEIGAAFDPLLLKMSVHGLTRAEAVERARQAADALCVLGLTTNIPYLRRILASPAFAAGETETDFVTRHAAALSRPVLAERSVAAALAAAALIDPDFSEILQRTPGPLAEMGRWSNA